MYSYLITDIKWLTADFNTEPDDTHEEDIDLPTQLIVQTSSMWSEDLHEMLFERVFEEYGWEPRSFNHEVLEDEDLLEELDIVEM